MDRKTYGTFSFWTPLAAVFGATGELFEIPGPFLRKVGWLSQTVCDIIGIDPLITLLEVDLLLVNNTYSLRKARRELGYLPIDDDMENVLIASQKLFEIEFSDLQSVWNENWPGLLPHSETIA